MRTLVVIIVGLFSGFVAGILLSELVGVVGILMFDRIIGIKYLPVILALVCAGAALLVDTLGRRGARPL